MKSKNSNFIPSRLARLRILSGMTQEELSKKLNISRSCIANYETGKKSPSEDIAKHIANYFKVDVEYFFSSGNIQIAGKAILRKSREFIDVIAATDKLDMSTISPLSRLALIEFYNFLQNQENGIKNDI